MNSRWLPHAMRVAPRLNRRVKTGPVRVRHALLINPFYPKDPHASFGKHVLTPTLALTSVAGATPPNWTVEYWDENLLQGPPPWKPFPQVVGISVHLTFAKRAYELARWYRDRGAIVILGGLHVLSCPQEATPHADALAVGDDRCRRTASAPETQRPIAVRLLKLDAERSFLPAHRLVWAPSIMVVDSSSLQWGNLPQRCFQGVTHSAAANSKALDRSRLKR